MRSRAVSLPFSCTLSTAASPTGCRVSSLRFRSSARLPAVVWMSISCSACASTEVSEVMAVNLSGPLSLHLHQPVDALRVYGSDFSTRPSEGNLRHLSPYLSHGAGAEDRAP